MGLFDMGFVEALSKAHVFGAVSAGFVLCSQLC